MELIRALEQLSLEVKRNKTANISKPCPSTSNQLYNFPHNNPSNSNNFVQTHPANKQIDDFDRSIDTLLLQLSDLEQPRLETTSFEDFQPSWSTSQKRRIRLSQWVTPAPSAKAFLANGSVETSQEEDSDSSSQQSKCATYTEPTNSSDHFTRPLVKNLMQRNLDDITTTVRKIGQILSIGNDIELINKSDQLDDYNLDVHFANSLCDTFNSLYLSEPFLRDLPTLKHYNQHCQRLVDRLKSSCFILERSTDCNSSTPDNSSRHMMDYSDDYESNGFALSNDDHLVDNDLQVNNWTENQLYIDNPQCRNTRN